MSIHGLDVLKRVDAALSEPSFEPVLWRGRMRIETPEGATGVAAPVLARLLERGYVRKIDTDGKTTYWSDSKTQLEQATLEYGVCDFCSSTDQTRVIMVPDFQMPVTEDKSTGGWAACDTCWTLVNENKRAELLRRSVEGAGVGKFGAAAVQALHNAFWKAHDDLAQVAGTVAALTDYIDGKLPSPEPIKNHRADTVRRLLGLTGDEIDAMKHGKFTYGETLKKLKRFNKTNIRQIIEQAEAGARRPIPPGQVPHWQRALDAKFAAITLLQSDRLSKERSDFFPDAIDLNNKQAVLELIKRSEKSQELEYMHFADDVRLLRAAETYSFNKDTIDAIQEAAKSIPHDSPLSSIETPNTGAGWFWFGSQLPIVSSPVASKTTAALLWGWMPMPDGRPGLRFSCYVIDSLSNTVLHGNVRPSTLWWWPLHMTFHDMIAKSIVEHRKLYGPGGPWKGRSFIGEEQTMKTVADMSLFFLSACVWFKQKILISAPGHIERHARKRYQREHKLAEPPAVRVIALREAMREPVTTTEASEKTTGARKISVRFVVRGHPRLQPCGPGLADKKLIWIDPYPKGPKDAPWRTREIVKAVIR